ncbi:ArnT family glycosyltransferase [Aquabacterium sp.]|uniref:ArnT family glycosyltransferase n=1 Tax=Aquabacterium sp. TaxID=1872578 RepID=UPI003CFCDA27
MNARLQESRVSPALVTQKAVQRLPRWALLLFCAAYVLPGLFGRDPWKNEDIASFGQMWGLALGQASWLHPNVGGVLPTSGGVLPYWLGGAFIKVLSPWVDPALAARLPFAVLLALILALTWYTTYHLARTKAAQPLPLAFGGEAEPADYARAVADGGVLALIATLGLLQLGHETTPELLQLTGSTLFLYGLAMAETRAVKARWAALLSLPVMAASGSPAVALMLGAAGSLICLLSRQAELRQYLRWVLVSMVLAMALASGLSALGLSGWSWRLSWPDTPGEVLRLLVWFTWPTLPLAVLTIWHWRRQVTHRHIAVPLLTALVGLLASLSMGANERALLTALPSLAVLAAFALPILQRSLGSAIDWFSVFFFTVCGILIWLGYVALHTGAPARTAERITKLVPGTEAQFSWLALIVALIGTVLWLGLVRWRTARVSHALWKSLVLPAGGVALCWLLFMTLWLPILDQARSYRALVERMRPDVPADTMVCAPRATVALMTGLEYFGQYRVDGLAPTSGEGARHCEVLIVQLPGRAAIPEVKGWQPRAKHNQRTRNSEQIVIYRR